MGAQASGVPSRAGSPAVKYNHPGKKTSIVATRHPSLKAYKQAVVSERSVPLSNQTAVQSAGRFHEVEFIDHGQRKVRLTGRDYLATLGSDESSVNMLAGAHFGAFPLSPGFLGGRLALMAQEFQYHKFLAAKVLYEPQVPATTTGSIILYHTTDIDVPFLDEGDDEIAHAATHPNMLETPVFQPAVLDIKPVDALLEYTDDMAGDPALANQGIILAMAGSAYALGTDTGHLPVLGHLYLEWEVEFSAPALSHEVPLRSGSTMSVTTGAAVGNRALGQNVSFAIVAAPLAQYPAVSNIASYPPGATANGDLVSWIFVAQVHDIPSSSPWGVNMKFRSSDDPQVYNWTIGQVVFIRFAINTTTGYVHAEPFSTLGAIGQPVSGGTATTGQLSGNLEYDADTTALTTSTMILKGWWWPINA